MTESVQTNTINGDTVVLKVAYDGNRKLTLTLTINGTPQKLTLTSASIYAGTPKGILVSGSVDPTNGASPATITLQNPPFLSGGVYEFVELNCATVKPNPRVIIRVNIP
ncbi:MAG: hypothetical protein RL632_210 [Bacteroidota bacterium]|jgi:hypothetical protein